MVCAHPVDGSGERFRQRLSDELGDDAWREAGLRRDIWYATILHFAPDIARPAELVEWVAQRRALNLGHLVCDTVELVRFHHEDSPTGQLMRPTVLAGARMGNVRQSTADLLC
jgi:hypothetical protein